MSYSLQTLWFERQRFLPGVLAVAFSALLIALQCGLLLGLFSITSLPIDETRADVWVGHPMVPSVDLGRPIPTSWQSYLSLPGVEQVEEYLQGFAYWDKPSGGAELCILIGSRLRKDSLGTVKVLTPEQRALLTEPGSVIIDDSEFERLGIKGKGKGAYAEVSGQRVRVVDTVHGMKSLAGPYVFCSIETARPLLRLNQDQTMFLLAKCRSPEDAQRVVDALSTEPYKKKLTAYTSPSFSLHSRLHWLTKTKAGIALGLAAALGLLVGAVVTSQTLYAATAKPDELTAEADLLASEREQGDTQFDEESGEGDTVNVERERDLALSATARQTVEDIERALSQMNDNTFGLCITCGDRIPLARLEVLPWSVQCVKCKARGERRR